MQSLSVRKQSLVSSAPAAAALAAMTFKTRRHGLSFMPAFRRIGWRFRCAGILVLVLGVLVGAQAQTAQLVNWTTAVGGSSVFGPVSIALDPSGNLYVVNNLSSAVIPGITGVVLKIPPSDPTCSTPGDCINVAPSYNSNAHNDDGDLNLMQPVSVSVDSGGDVFIQMSYSNWYSSPVSNFYTFVRVPSTDLTCSTPGDCIETIMPNICSEIAVDGSGNVYDCYAYPNDGPYVVMEYTLSGNTYTATATNIPETVAQELGGNPGAPLFAADASGNLYTIVGQSLTKYTALGGGAFTATTISTNFPGPIYAVAVDWSGNIYASGDGGLWKFVPASGGAYTQSLQGPTVNAFTGDASGDLYIGFPYGGDYLFERHTGPVNFGSVNVGATSAPIQLNFQWWSTPSGPSPALTQGAAGQDFIPATSVGSLNGYPAYPNGYPDGSCGNYYQYSPCYVYVQFTPTKAGERQGAEGVIVSGATAGTTLIAGTGVAPQAVIYPGTQSAPYTASSSGLGAPGGLAMDGFGDVYIADSANNQVVAQASGGQIVVANAASNGLASPAGTAVDGAGNVYIADTGNSRIVEETLSNPSGTAIEPGSGYSYTQSTLTTSALSAPQGIAVDGAGNVYIADTGNNRVLMETLSNGTYTETTIGTNLVAPAGVAVDGSGNVYIADTGNNRVVKETLSAGVYTQSVLVGGLGEPQGVAVDGGGNVYIADTGNNRVLLELGSGSSYTQMVVASGLNSPQAVTVSGTGNVYIADTNNQRVVLVDVSDPPTLTFPVTQVGNSSSPQSLTLVNIGNAPLSIAVPASGDNPAIGPDFTLNSGEPSTCPVVGSGASAATLAASASCELSISFTPTTADAVNESLVLTDNHLNGTNVTQTISLHGDGLIVPVITWPTPAAIPYGTALTATQLDATANVAGTIVYTPALGTVLTAGSQTLSMTFTPTDTTDYATTTAIVTLQVNQITSTITWAAPAAIQDGTALSATQLDATANTSGTFVYTPAAGTVLPFGTQTLSVNFTPYDTTDYTTATASVPLTVIASSGAVNLSGYRIVVNVTPQPGAGSLPGGFTDAVAGDPSGGSPITFDGGGNFYTAGNSDATGGAGVLKWTPSGGTYTPSVVVPLNSDHVIALAADASGDVYVGLYDAGAVVKETPSANGYTQSIVASWNGMFGNGAGWLAVDGAGNVYINDPGNHEIVMATPASGGYTLSTVVSGPYTGLAVDQSGNVYSNKGVGSGTGVFAGYKFTPSSGGYTESTLPGGGQLVCVDAAGNLYFGSALSGGPAAFEYSPSGGGYVLTASITGPGPDVTGLATDPNGNLFTVDYYNQTVWRVSPSTNNIGNTALSSTYAGTFPAPAFSRIVLSSIFTFNAAGSIGGYTVSSGYGGRFYDFNDGGTGSCASSMSYNAGDTCTVDVFFTPAFAGARYGAVELKSSAATVLATSYVQGTGLASEAVIYPGTQSVPFNAASNGLSQPTGFAIDGESNIYIADTANNQVLVHPIGNSASNQIVIANSSMNGLSGPTGIAVDSSGSVLIADTGNSRVLKETLSEVNGLGINNQNPTPSWTQSTLATSTLSGPKGVAVDGAGNVYIADTGNNRVLMETFSNGGYIESTLGSDLNGPAGVAVDGGGNVYIADTGNNQVLIEALSGGTYTQSVVVNGLNQPQAVSVDGSGNVYIDDTGNNRTLLEALSGGVYTQILVASGLNSPQGLAVYGSGNVYIADTANQRVVEMDVVDPQTLTFPATPVGYTSSPETLTLVNIGNAPLSITVPASGDNPSLVMNYPPGTNNSFQPVSGSSSTCPKVSSGSSEAGTLAAGAACDSSFSFTAGAYNNGYLGAYSASLSLSSNTLNGIYGASGQSVVQLYGSATQASPITPRIISVSQILPQQTQTITISGSGFGTESAYAGDSSFILFADPTGTPWYAGDAGNPVTLSIASWSDTQIVLTGFTGAYGTDGMCIKPGDQLYFKVWNQYLCSGSGNHVGQRHPSAADADHHHQRFRLRHSRRIQR
ncbi:MAG: hypothetical protein ABR976_08710 [Terracidiphilus sp.]